VESVKIAVARDGHFLVEHEVLLLAGLYRFFESVSRASSAWILKISSCVVQTGHAGVVIDHLWIRALEARQAPAFILPCILLALLLAPPRYPPVKSRVQG
jgi:hypothetical protein